VYAKGPGFDSQPVHIFFVSHSSCARCGHLPFFLFLFGYKNGPARSHVSDITKYCNIQSFPSDNRHLEFYPSAEAARLRSHPVTQSWCGPCGRPRQKVGSANGTVGVPTRHNRGTEEGCPCLRITGYVKSFSVLCDSRIVCPLLHEDAVITGCILLQRYGPGRIREGAARGLAAVPHTIENLDGISGASESRPLTATC
jgi:hypothetical protein